MMRKFAFAILAVALAVPAVAAPETGSEASKPEKPKKEKKICKRVETSESRMGSSICKTAAEWEQGTADGSQKVGLGTH